MPTLPPLAAVPPVVPVAVLLERPHALALRATTVASARTVVVVRWSLIDPSSLGEGGW